MQNMWRRPVAVSCLRGSEACAWSTSQPHGGLEWAAEIGVLSSGSSRVPTEMEDRTSHSRVGLRDSRICAVRGKVCRDVPLWVT